MAAPNIVNVATLTGETTTGALGTSLATYITVATNYVAKVGTVLISNTSATTDAVVSLVVNQGTDRYVLYNVTVPVGTTLVAVSKDAAIWLEEGNTLKASRTSAGGTADIIISYEYIVD